MAMVEEVDSDLAGPGEASIGASGFLEVRDDLPWTAADRAYGWRFGCSGAVRMEAAKKELGGVSRYVVMRLVKKGKIRAGFVAGVRVYCRESILRFIATAEE